MSFCVRKSSWSRTMLHRPAPSMCKLSQRRKKVTSLQFFMFTSKRNWSWVFLQLLHVYVRARKLTFFWRYWVTPIFQCVWSHLVRNMITHRSNRFKFDCRCGKNSKSPIWQIWLFFEAEPNIQLKAKVLFTFKFFIIWCKVFVHEVSRWVGGGGGVKKMLGGSKTY